MTHEFTDANFETKVLQSDLPVLVDFWAPWCGPCKMIGPIIEEIAKDYAGRMNVGKVNVDDNQELPAKYGVRGIPTLMIFKAGELVTTKVGAVSKADLVKLIDGAL